MKLSANFELNEFIHPGDIAPTDDVIDNLKLLAQRLQALRDFLGKPIHINSGYRSASHNAAVGGASNSYHLLGMAADIVVEGMTPHEVQCMLVNWSGGMGCYDTFTHVDIRDFNARW